MAEEKKKSPSSLGLLLSGKFIDAPSKKEVLIIGPLLNWMSGNDMDYGPLAAGVGFFLLVISLLVLGVCFDSGFITSGSFLSFL